MLQNDQNNNGMVIYNSSAGSGKTYTLAVEYICIAISDELNYKRILAITFTNKAMAEMKERILRFLDLLSKEEDEKLLQLIKSKTNLSDAEIKKRAKYVLSSILYNYSYFSVTTIDSFFQRLIKSFAAELNIYINYELLLDTEDLVESVINELLTRSKNDEKLLFWVQKYITDFIKEDKSFYDIKTYFSTAVKELLKENLHEKIKHNSLHIKSLDDVKILYQNLIDLKNQYEESLDAIGKKAISILDKNGIKLEDITRGSSGAAGFFSNILKSNKNYTVNSYVEKATQGTEYWFRKGEKSPFADVVQKELYPLLCEAVSIINEHSKDYTVSLEQLKNIYTFAVVDYINILKDEYIKENNSLLIGDTLKHISELLKENEDCPFLYDKIGTYYNHILLDEAQDTSEMQWKNLLPLIKNSLAQNGKVIIVGDVKQSIYRWRGGKPDLLAEQMEKDVHPYKTVKINLNTNYRSAADIVDRNNAVIKKILQSLLENKYNIEKYYEAYEQKSNNNEKGYIKYDFVSKNFLKNNEILFEDFVFSEVLNIIKNCLNRGFLYSDIAILARKNDECSQIAEYLKLQQIPVLSSEALFVQNNECVKFIISALKYVQDEKDEISKLHMLQFLRPKSNGKILADLKNKDFQKHLPEDFVNAVKELKNKTISDALNQIIAAFKLGKNSPDYLVTLLDLANNFSKQKSPSVEDFIEFWDDKVFGGNFSVSIPEGENAVIVSTIHKSKGLEYKIVIIPSAKWKIGLKPENTSWFLTNQDIYYPLKNVKALSQTYFKEQFEAESLSNLLEAINTFYVAITRAVNELYVFSSAEGDSSMLQSFLKSALKDELSETEYGFVHEFGEKITNLKAVENKINTLMIDSVSVSNFKGSIRLSPLKNLESEAQSSGLVLHHILENSESESDLNFVIDELMYKGEISHEEAQNYRKMLLPILEIEQLKTWHGTLFKKFKEQEFYNSKTLKTLRPDNVFISDEECVVLDYKLRYSKESERKYQKQITEYCNLMENLFNKKTQGYILYIEDVKIEKVR